MIQAVLWDFGGVLTTSPFEAFNRYEADNGIPLDFIRGINATNPQTNAWAQFESSRMSLDEFDGAFEAETAQAGHPIPGRVVVGLLSGQVRPRMVAALKACKSQFKVGCLTNNVKSGEGPGMARDHDKALEVQRVMALFDVVVESSKEGMRKPQPAFYELACERLGVDASSTVFLDDLGINLKPARALGMQTIKVVSEDQALSDLEAAVGISLA